MKVEVAIESDGVLTRVTREYEPVIVVGPSDDVAVTVHREVPSLGAVAQTVAEAAVIAHRPTYLERARP